MKKAFLKRFIKFNFIITVLLALYTKSYAPARAIQTSLGKIPATPDGLANWFLERALGVASGVALLLIIFGGIKYITSQGDFKAVDEAKKTITSALVGFLVIFLSVLILAIMGGSTILDIEGWGDFFTP